MRDELLKGTQALRAALGSVKFVGRREKKRLADELEVDQETLSYFYLRRLQAGVRLPPMVLDDL